MKRFLAVKNFETYQHYHDRTPPWIKLYNSLLDDYAFLELSDAARSQLVLIWLVASRQNNRIPYDAKWIARAIHCTGRLDLDALVASGWLYFVDASESLAERSNGASERLAKVEQNATAPCARGEGEAEKETETEKNNHDVGAREAVRSKLPSEYRADFDALLERTPTPAALLAEMGALNSGMHGPPRSWGEIGGAVRDYVANGKHVRFNLRQFRRYVGGLDVPSGNDLAERARQVRAEEDARLASTQEWLATRQGGAQ